MYVVLEVIKNWWCQLSMAVDNQKSWTLLHKPAGRHSWCSTLDRTMHDVEDVTVTKTNLWQIQQFFWEHSTDSGIFAAKGQGLKPVLQSCIAARFHIWTLVIYIWKFFSVHLANITFYRISRGYMYPHLCIRWIVQMVELMSRSRWTQVL
jgi:hypothetical protein